MATKEGEDVNMTFDSSSEKAQKAEANAAKAAKTKESLPWVEKYRPSTLDELISHGDIISTINDLIEKNRMPHLLLYGPPGTGKTSTILACARKMNGPKASSMILELNASDDRGIDVVREQIVNFASSRQLFSGGFKLVLLDEADALTKTAQFALRRVIEKYTKSTRFCLICNYINKIIPALQSRCTRFRFAPLQRMQMMGRVVQIAEAEKVNTSEDGVEAIVDLSGGDMRKCLNVLQACHMAFSVTNAENVYLCTGKPTPSDIQSILDFLLNTSYKEAYNGILQIQKDRGLSLVDIISSISTKILKIKFEPQVLGFILTQLADIEYRLAKGGSEKLQLGSLVGAFQIAVEALVPKE